MSAAEKRLRLEAQNRLDFIAFKRAGGHSCETLAHEFGCSRDSIERYLTGARPVPGYIVAAMRGRVAA